MKVLFVCTGNTCRSPMAEGYFRHLCNQAGRDDIVVDSAGTFAPEGGLPSPQSVQTLKTIGVDISELRSQPLSKALLDSCDVIATMTESHRYNIGQISPKALAKTKRLLEYADDFRDVADPYGGSVADYNACFAEMRSALDNLFLDIVKPNHKD